MSQLILVRHGQAAAPTPGSDHLTDLGRQQAHKLGQYWLARDVRFDEVYCGPLQRQLDTERVVADVYRAAGRAWPEAQSLPGFGEYDAGALLGTLAPLLSAREPAFARLMREFREHAQAHDWNRYFQRMLEALMDRWVAGELDAGGVETFASFHARVAQARAEIFAREGSRRVVVFTSGGPIGVCVQLALQAPKETAMRLNWRVKNGSLTEFAFSAGRPPALISFNVASYLPDALLTRV